MTGIFSRFNNFFTNEKPQAQQPTLSKAHREGGYGHVLDPSSATSIDLPEIAGPNIEKDRQPQEYWETYNKGVSFYGRKHYEKAKDQFLRLLNYQNPHYTFYTYLLRTYRKIISKNIEKGNLQNACSIFKDFFIVCKEHITDTDRRKFNKLIKILLKENPMSDYEEIKLTGKKIKPDYEIDKAGQSILTLLNEVKREKNGIKITNWDFIEQVGLGSIYVKSLFNKELLRYDKSMLRLRTATGEIQKEFTVEHRISKFQASSDSDKFIAASCDDMMLYFYSLRDGCQGTYNLKKHTEDKYHIRSIYISPDGDFLLFTERDKAYLMDARVKIIESWKTPLNEGWEEKESDATESVYSAEYKRNLSTLGLSGNPADEEIKKAFRNMVLRHHPDRHQGDIEATERTKEIIGAYEALTHEDAKQAFEGLEGSQYYYKMMDQAKVDIPGTDMSFTIEFGMSGGYAEDWISATWLGSNANKIYLGCYSGKLYCIFKNGHVAKLYNCHDPIKAIREEEEYLFIETDCRLFIIKDDKCLKHIDRRESGDIRWHGGGFMLIKTREVSLFLDNGVEIGKIYFKNSIHDIYWVGNDLNVLTAKKIYVFSKKEL